MVLARLSNYPTFQMNFRRCNWNGLSRIVRFTDLFRHNSVKRISVIRRLFVPPQQNDMSVQITDASPPLMLDKPDGAACPQSVLRRCRRTAFRKNRSLRRASDKGYLGWFVLSCNVVIDTENQDVYPSWQVDQEPSGFHLSPIRAPRREHNLSPGRLAQGTGISTDVPASMPASPPL